MDTEKIVGVCPKCGKTLEIPGDLLEFSCLYCGARLSPDGLLPLQRVSEPAPVGNGQACLDFGIKGLVAAVSQYPKAMQNLTRGGFVPFFERYEAETAPSVEQLDLAARELGVERTAEKAADGFLTGLSRWLEESHKPLASKANETEDAKFVVCLFLLPMIRKQALEISEPLAAAIFAAWKKAYPKHVFSMTTYDEIMEGFRKKRLCFITTAVCQTMGKRDDCQELTAFRAFRDGYLLQCADGPALIGEYYDVAPGIVIAIRDGGQDGEFDQIWAQYLAPCYDAIGRGDNEGCKKTYTEMVQALKEKYLKV